MDYGGSLLGVEAGKVVVWLRGGHGRIKDSEVHCANESCFRFVRNKDRPGHPSVMSRLRESLLTFAMGNS